MTVNNKIGKPKRALTNSDRDRLSELLRKRLIECGWKDQVRMLYHQVVRESESENISFDMIVSKMTPRAHALVPDAVKKEFIKKIIACRGPRILKYIRARNPETQTEDLVEVEHIPEMEQDIPDLEDAQNEPEIDLYLPQLPEQSPQIGQ